ncbi:MAG TPA: glycosyltransferase [Bacteroidia bacterium]
MNQKVLFIAYQFPPMGGPGVQRSTRFVQYLNKFGYDPIVLTIHSEDIKRNGNTIDESLLNFIPKDTEIYRTPSAIPFKTIQVLSKLKLFRLFWLLFYPLFWERSAIWPYKTFKTASELVKKNNIKLVYTSSGPFSSLILGRLLKKKLGVKWVADMRDPYTDAYSWSFPTKWHWLISRWKEKRALSASDVLIVNTDEVKKLYVKRKIKPESEIVVITNGY